MYRLLHTEASSDDDSLTNIWQTVRPFSATSGVVVAGENSNKKSVFSHLSGVISSDELPICEPPTALSPLLLHIVNPKPIQSWVLLRLYLSHSIHQLPLSLTLSIAWLNAQGHLYIILSAAMEMKKEPEGNVAERGGQEEGEGGRRSSSKGTCKGTTVRTDILDFEIDETSGHLHFGPRR